MPSLFLPFLSKTSNTRFGPLLSITMAALMVACLSAVETETSAATLSALLQPRPSSSSSSSSSDDQKSPLLQPSESPKTTATTTTTTTTTNSSMSSPALTLGPDDPRLVARNRHGHTALHCAAFAQSPTAVRMLLRAGADCTIGDKAGRTAVEVALNLNKKSATVLREGPRGGSAPAAECLRLLKERCVCVCVCVYYLLASPALTG